MHAFRNKAPLDDLMARIPVKVILHAEPGLLGAAVHAQGKRDHRAFEGFERFEGCRFKFRGSVASKPSL